MRATPTMLLGVSGLVVLGVAPLAGAATWTPVRGTLPLAPIAASSAGGRIYLASAGPGLSITTLYRARVISSQVLVRSSRDLDAPQMVRSTTGIVVLAYSQNDRIWASVKLPGTRRFSKPRPVSGPEGGFARVPSLAAGPGGRVVLAWWGAPVGGTEGIQVARLGTAGGWSRPVNIASGVYRQGQFPSQIAVRAAFGPDGSTAVAWTQNPPTSSAVNPVHELAAARANPDGAWAAPIVLDSGQFTGGSTEITVAPLPADGVQAAWSKAISKDADGLVTRVCLDSAEARSNVAPVLSEIQCVDRASELCVRGVISPDGTVRLSWASMPYFSAQYPIRSSVLTARRDPSTGAWDVPQVLITDSDGAQEPQVWAAYGARAVLGAYLAEALPGHGGTGRVTVVVLRGDGTVERRIVRAAPRRGVRTQYLFALPGVPQILRVGATGQGSLLRF